MNPGPPSIVLIGMMGSGKSTVGLSLQKRTGLPCFDTDELIVAKAGMSIPEIFAQKGEEWFRDLETAVLTDLLAKPAPSIIVTGGGAVLWPGNAAMLKDFGTVVWLDAEVETLFERASRHGNRPLLQTRNPRATLAEMLAVRRPLYTKIADIHIETTGRGVEEVTDSVMSEIEKLQKSART